MLRSESSTIGVMESLPGLARVPAALAIVILAAACAAWPKSRSGGQAAAAPPAAVKTAATAAATPDAPVPAGPMKLTVAEAVVTSLKNNRSFKVEELKPALSRAAEDLSLAAFDPVLSGQAGQSWSRGPSSAGGDISGHAATLAVTLDKLYPWGLQVQGGVKGDMGQAPGSDSAGLSVGATQPLLRGYGSDVNLVSLRQARLDTRVSEYELKGFAQDLVAQVEEAYWDLVLATKQEEIYHNSLDLAGRQLAETEERIKVGKLAEIEGAASRAEVALRREDLINARSNIEVARLKVLRLLAPPGEKPWAREIALTDQPIIVEIAPEDIETAVQRALEARPDYNQAMLQVERGRLEVVRTKNGLLPKLDFFLNLGKTGYSGSFGGAVSDVGGRNFDLSLGLTAQWPLGNRGARASDLRAELSLESSREAVANLAQLVQSDVRGAYVELNRSREQVSATSATRALSEEKLRAETEKFRVGKSTAYLVAQAQRDLIQSQTGEVSSAVSFLKSIVELYRLQGTLLERRGIALSAPTPAP